MKKIIGILGILFSVALAYYSSGSVAGSPFIPAFGYAADSGPSGTMQKTWAPSRSADLFCHTARSEHSVTSFNTTSSASQHPAGGFWAVLKLADRLFERTYAQYTARSANFPIQLRKADIIFPFHYFW